MKVILKIIKSYSFYPWCRKKNSSGKKNKSYPLSKGIPIVKKQLYCAAVAALKHNNELRQVYNNAINKGFNSKKALFKVMVKLAKIIWHLYNYNCLYNPAKVFVANPINAWYMDVKEHINYIRLSASYFFSFFTWHIIGCLFSFDKGNFYT